ncbi:hypothetical protein EUX98_g5829 [Antrodiella citrinella]|uniref:F-box domain-containing protein n=1 Tax=Antrodiella citrinella TaxID=2447956 RepID=A0A4S4MQU2_9APHY|nr:hypothetical protein EUX98_g5829 [Antrodiella citrinella]
MSKYKVEKVVCKLSKEEVLPRCFLNWIPLEILAEVLLNTASPRDAVALARCSKFFCATLVNNPSTSYIWKSLRQKRSIPPPMPNWTESSYAAFLFDEGPCEVCKKKFNGFLYSFSLRLRLCGTNQMPSDNDCRRIWRKEHSIELNWTTVQPRYTPLLSWLPVLESAVSDVTVGRRIVRKIDWEQLVDAFNKAAMEGTLAAFLARGTRIAKRTEHIVKYSDQLVSWKQKQEAQAKTTKESNDEIAKNIAKSEGWQYWDMKMSVSFSTLRRCKNLSVELLTHADINVIRASLEEEIINVGEAHDRRRKESEYHDGRVAVEKRYNDLRIGGSILPPLEDFRKLHTMQLVVEQPSAVKILTSHQLDKPLEEELNIWVRDARNALGKVLGYPDWKTPSTSRVHVVDRVNTRFLCLSHICPKLRKDQRKKAMWSADNFVADTHAIVAINQVLAAAKIDPVRLKAAEELHELHDRIVCHTCPVPLVMNSDVMVRHSRRHDVAIFNVVSREAADLILQGAPFKSQWAERLRKGLGDCKRLRTQHVFSCRHCAVPKAAQKEADTNPSASVEATEVADVHDEVVRIMPPPAATDEAVELAVAPEGPTRPTLLDPSNPGPSESAVLGDQPSKALLRQKRRKTAKANAVYDFNGIRSHVKAKHGIAWIGDEDFYQVPAS